MGNKIALIGLGSMGKAVKRVAEERGHEVALIVDPHAAAAHARPPLTAGMLDGVDVVVDFSLGEAVMENVRACREAGVPLVIGSTGWYERMDEVKAAAEGIACMWSSNFSIGVNMYFRIVEEAAKLVDKFEEYDVWGHEIHHYNKADSPSGTAKSLEKILLENVARKTKVVEDKLDRKPLPEELHFSSLRAGAVNFAHTIGLDSAADRITITHEARCRDGYALGAVKAAEWLKGCEPGFYRMEDFLQF